MNLEPLAEPALLVFSGGQDSTTLLYWAKKKFSGLTALTFRYGQRHAVELKQAEKIAQQENVPQIVTDLTSLFALNTHNALLDPTMVISEKAELHPSVPNTFVPGRNLLFLNVAMMVAYAQNIRHLIVGMSQADYSGYPDCREPFVRATEQALRLATEREYVIHTPLMFLTKADTWRMAQDLGALADVVELSHTCYEGDRIHRHAWGYGCGSCPACVLRKQGYEEAFG